MNSVDRFSRFQNGRVNWTAETRAVKEVAVMKITKVSSLIFIRINEGRVLLIKR
jgi:hypothetical protein